MTAQRIAPREVADKDATLDATLDVSLDDLTRER